jgi:uncharacterized membrane protein
MTICPKCQADNPNDAPLCESCGESLALPDIGSEPSSTGWSPNILAMLSYLLMWLSGLIIYNVEKNNEFVKFHAMQSIIVFGVLFYLALLLNMIIWWVPGLGTIVWLVFGVVLAWPIILFTVLLWVYLMFKAYRGEKYKVWRAGNLAEKLLLPSSPPTP